MSTGAGGAKNFFCTRYPTLLFLTPPPLESKIEKLKQFASMRFLRASLNYLDYGSLNSKDLVEEQSERINVDELNNEKSNSNLSEQNIARNSNQGRNQSINSTGAFGKNRENFSKTSNFSIKP